MKVKNILLLACFYCATLCGQDRYVAPFFTNVLLEENIEYGINANILPGFFGMPAEPQILEMDIYSPEDDLETERPLIIMLSPGGFLPFPINQEVYQNNRKDLEIVYMADRLAKYGYVVAVIDLRLGWNPLAPTQPERALSLIQACMRQCQDLRTAIRFFRRSVAEENNPYAIDPNKIVAWGDDSGVLPLGFASYITDYESEFVPNYLFDLGAGPIPAWSESIHGDIYGLSYGISPSDGDTLSYPNHVGYDSHFNLVMQQGGAFIDTITISPEDPPLISCQSFTEGKFTWWQDLTFNPGTDPVVSLFGAGAIQERINNVGLNFQLLNIDFFDPITLMQEERAAMSPDFFPEDYPELFPFDSGHSTPWSFWDSDNENDAFSAYSSSNDHDYCKSVLDTIIDFYAPRACIVLNLVCHSDTFDLATNNLTQNINLNLSPNPARVDVFIESENGSPMQSIEIYDVNGSLVKSINEIHQTAIDVSRGNLPDGLYVIKVFFENGFIAKKVVFN